MAYKSKLWTFSDEDFIKIVAESDSFAECCRKVGICDRGRHGLDAIRKRCQMLTLDTSHFHSRQYQNSSTYRPLEEILVKDSSYTNTSSLKKRLIKEKVLTYKCAFCGNEGTWNGQHLVLELDHINGDHHDNRLENLRLLCPNCHSQTPTFSGRNKKATPC